ncbi:phage tail protein [Micromonospora sp. NPDC005806]|uniref:phage tail protein n=1 Tax=Micromonospora sp. NPDC005806 TaxID=3364234 RepID=UPI0036CFFE86
MTRLADLLPDVLLAEDSRLPDRPLRRLLEVLDGRLDQLRVALEQLQRDPFVARCSPEALPLLAELVGARLVGDDPATARAVVAGTVGWRRRQGTPGTLEDVLGRTTGWPAEVDEGFRSLLVTQELDEPLPARGWTVLLDDPVALADPLTRPARRGPRFPSRALAGPTAGDDVTEELRRLGAADALHPPASPRTVDLGGWARPDAVLVRTSRAAVAERDQVVLPPARVLPGPGGPGLLLGLTLDPAGQDIPVAARVLVGRTDADPGQTSMHETPPSAPVARRPELLTPTDLADDPLAVAEGDALTLTVDDVALLGAAVPGVGSGVAGPLPFGPPGAAAVLRFADAGRPGPGETWALELLAVAPDAPADEDVDLADPAVAPPVLTATVDATAADLAVLPDPALGGETGEAVAALRVRRVAGGDLTWRRDAAGGWTAAPVATHPGDPVSACVVLAGPPEEVVRLVRTTDAVPGLELARHVPGDPDWRMQPLDLDPLPAADRPGAAWLDPGPAATLVPDGADLLLLAPGPDGAQLRAWRLSDLAAAAAAVTALDAAADPGARRPAARAATAACLLGDVLTLHGGEAGGAALLDLWQLPLAGPGAGRWVQRRVRGRIARSGGALLAGPQGLVRLGGAGDGPGLNAEVSVIDLNLTRPGWQPLPSLPGLTPGAPGAAWGRIDAAGGLEALVWADRTRPVTLTAAAGAGWTVGAAESAAPNPPAEGEVVALADGWFVAGPAPLPAAEVVVSVAGTGRLLFVPPLDPAFEPVAGGGAPDPERRTVLLADADGGTRRWFPGGEIARRRLRFGRNRETGAMTSRPSPAVPRVGAAGRLAWTPLQLRQASLGPWAGPLALALDDAVAFDPRLGRIALAATLGGVRPAGDRPRFAASYHVARGVAFGAGFVPPRGALPARWYEPEDVADRDRYALPDAPAVAGAAVTVGPPGRRAPAGGEVLTGLEPALEAVAGASGPATVAVIGSPRLAAATVTVREDAATAVLARDPGGYPYLVPDDAGVSLSLLERADAAGAGRGPRVLLQGLALGGALEVALTAGAVDLRWCDLGSPLPAADPAADPPDPDTVPPTDRPAALAGAAGPGTALGVRVAGAGRRTALPRGGAAAVTLVLRLHGCRVGRLEVPPWVRVIAAGCTFDSGSRRATAIAAAGAVLRLRECTVRGRTVAGVLEASSSVFAGALDTERSDVGWLRRCVAPLADDRRPRAWRGSSADVSFADGRPGAPGYLVLDDNNAADVLAIGEGGRPPGAHAERGRGLRELAARSDDFLPLGLQAQHRDRVADDVCRMGRSNR